MKFTLILYFVCLILIGCKNTKNKVIDKKTISSRAKTQIIVNSRTIEFSYDPVPPNELPYRYPKGDFSGSNWNLDHGSVAEIMDLSISSIKVNYFSDEWENLDSVIKFLINVLHDPESRTYDAPNWSQPFFLSIMCTVNYNNGKYGKWLISTERWTSSFEDQSGKVWFVVNSKFAKN